MMTKALQTIYSISKRGFAGQSMGSPARYERNCMSDVKHSAQPAEVPELPPSLPPPIPSRSVQSPAAFKDLSTKPELPIAAITIGGAVGLIAGVLMGIAIVQIAASLARSDPRGASFTVSAVSFLGWFAILWIAAAVIFGIRAGGSSLFAVIFILPGIAKHLVASHSASASPATVSMPGPMTVVMAAMIWAVAGAILARRLSRPKRN